jgi:hypothetical protein
VRLSTGSGAEGSGVAIGFSFSAVIAFLGVFITFSMGGFVTASIMAADSVWELSIITQCALFG